MKRCSKCGETKPLDDFPLMKSARDGRHSWCCACKSAGMAAYRNTEQGRRTAATHGQAWKVDNIKRRASARRRVIAHYSGGTNRCACCGSTEKLSIDHMHGGGSEHRASLGRHGFTSAKFYHWLSARGFPPGYQVLCLPCNQSKKDTPACRLHPRAVNA